jgi:hypothetical protein
MARGAAQAVVLEARDEQRFIRRGFHHMHFLAAQ